jgi:hypothetical protein
VYRLAETKPCRPLRAARGFLLLETNLSPARLVVGHDSAPHPNSANGNRTQREAYY